MKRQLVGNKSGFTLFELMVVIAIFGVFVATTSVFNYSPQTETEKADRILNAISSRIKAELQNISIGRMPQRDGRVSSMVQITIGSGSMLTSYFTGSTSPTPFLTGSFRPPYFDGDSLYEIKSVVWTGSATVPNGYEGTGTLIIDPLGVSFTGAGIYGSGYTLLEIKVGYMTRSRKVILDRRTGKMTEYKLY